MVKIKIEKRTEYNKVVYYCRFTEDRNYSNWYFYAGKEIELIEDHKAGLQILKKRISDGKEERRRKVVLCGVYENEYRARIKVIKDVINFNQGKKCFENNKSYEYEVIGF